MSQIIIDHLTFGYENTGENVFDSVEFSFDTSWKLGVVGRNGYGKTTLLKLLAHELDDGGAIRSGNTRFIYFPYLFLDETLSVCEIGGAAVEAWRFRKELFGLGISEEMLNRPYSELSKGEQTKVQIAYMFAKEDAFMLIDEPTNHLDAEGRAALSKYLKSKKSFILTSHDRTFLDACVDHILTLNRTKIVIQPGNYTDYLTQKALLDQAEQSHNEKLSQDIKRLKEASKQKSSWSNAAEQEKYGGKSMSGLRPDRGYLGAKSAKMMKSSKVLEDRYEKMIQEKEGLLSDIERSEPIKLNYIPFRAEVLSALEKVSVSIAGRRILAPVDLTVKRGEKIALTGANGTGKSTLMRVIKGEIIPTVGNLYLPNDLKISYIPQDTKGLSGTLEDYCARYATDKTRILAVLYKLGTDSKSFEGKIEDFSEGQKKKLLIARSLCEEAHLYLWDEPLNYLDIQAREQVKQLLKTVSPSMIFVEHDRDFVESVATRTLIMGPLGIR